MFPRQVKLVSDEEIRAKVSEAIESKRSLRLTFANVLSTSRTYIRGLGLEVATIEFGSNIPLSVVVDTTEFTNVDAIVAAMKNSLTKIEVVEPLVT